MMFFFINVVFNGVSRYIWIIELCGTCHGRAFHRWFRGRVVCALDFETGDSGSIPGSLCTTDWLFSAGW